MFATRILLVEDDLINRKLTAVLLEDEGYDVIQARTAEAGIKLAISEQPDLIIMDTTLPDMDGLDAVRSLRERDETRDIPIVAIMDEPTPAAGSQAMSAGCVGSMAKRFTFPCSFMSPSTFIRTLYGFVPPSAVPKVRSDRGGKLAKGMARVCETFAKALISLRRSYPEGALVELNDGSVCIVRRQNRESGLRPIVELVMDKDGNHPKEPVSVDLSASKTLAIAHCVNLKAADAPAGNGGAGD